MRNLIFLAVAFLCLSGCYGGIQVAENFGVNSSYNNDSTQIVFFKFIHVFRPAKGVLAFPDGGIPKTLYSNASVYLLDINSQTLTRVHNYGPVGGGRSRWTTSAFFYDENIFCNLQPRMGWDMELRYPSRGIDSVVYSNIKGWFSYSLPSKQTTRIRTPIVAGSIACPKVAPPKLDELTSHFKYKQWGVDFSEIYPQSKFKRVAEIAKLKHSIAYRNAIIEELEGQLSNRKIDKLIKRIDKYLDSESDYNRQRLMRSRNITVEKLLSIKQAPS